MTHSYADLGEGSSPSEEEVRVSFLGEKANGTFWAEDGEVRSGVRDNEEGEDETEGRLSLAVPSSVEDCLLSELANMSSCDISVCDMFVCGLSVEQISEIQNLMMKGYKYYI